MNQFVADDEYGLRFHGQEDRQDHVFPDGEPIRDQDLPHAENERRRPQKRPGPDRQVVPQQAAFRGPRRVHIASVAAEYFIERSRDAHEEECGQQPPAAMDGGEQNQREYAEWQVVRKGVKDRWLDVLCHVGLVLAYG